MKILRKVFLWLVIIVSLLIGLFYLIINSSYVSNKATEYIAQKYNIRYDHVAVSAFDGFKIEGFYYKDKKIATKIDLMIDPFTLLKEIVTISYLLLEGINEKNLEYMISDLADNSNYSDGRLQFGLNIKTTTVVMLPFQIEGVKFDKVNLNAKHIRYINNSFEFELLELNGTTSVGKVSTRGVYRDHNLYIDRLKIIDFDTKKAEKFFLKYKHNPIGKISNLIAPKKIFIRNFHGTILPRRYHRVLIPFLSDKINIDRTDTNTTSKTIKHVDINNITLKASNTVLKLSSPLTIEKGDISLDMDTNIAKLTQSGSIVDNVLTSHTLVNLTPATLHKYGLAFQKDLLSHISINTIYRLNGSKNILRANISSKIFNGHCIIDKSGKGHFYIESKQRKLQLMQYINLPEWLKNSWFKVSINIPIELSNIFPIKADIKLLSNIVDIDAKANYGDIATIDATATVSKNSLLEQFNKNIRVDTLSPMKIHTELVGENVATIVNSAKMNLNANFNLKSGAIYGDVDVSGSKLSIGGSFKDNIVVNLSSSSIKSILDSLSSIYKINPSDINGDLLMRADIKKLSSIILDISSNKITVGKDKKDGFILSDLSVKIKADKSAVEISNYALSAGSVKIYSNKASKIVFKNNKIVIPKLLLNDTIVATGEYDQKTKIGKLKVSALDFNLSNEFADIVTMLDIKTDIHNGMLSVAGKVHLKEGRIKYNTNRKSLAIDNDIIILQRQNKHKNIFETNLSIDLRVDSKSPIAYQVDGINILIKPNLHIKKKQNSPLRIYGKIDLLKGSYYTFKDKRFIISKGVLYFNGSSKTTTLDINLAYKHAGTTILVKVTGTSAKPLIYFSSDPHMSQEEILSLIFFDTNRRDNKVNGVASLLTSALAKSLFSNIGLRLDHLVLTKSGLEIGKNLSDKITLLYDYENSSSVKIRIENTKNIETDISFGTNSRSADIFYKQEF